MEKSRFIAPAAPTRQGYSSAQWFQLKAWIINQCSWAQYLADIIISSSEPWLLQGLNWSLLLCDVPFRPISGGFTSFYVKPCDRVTNAIAQQGRSGKTFLYSSSCAYTPCQPSNTDIIPTAQHGPAHSASISKRKPCCLCVFSFSNTHPHKLKEGRNVWHFCSDHLAEAPLHFLATQTRS